MESTFARDERVKFSERLRATLIASQVPTKLSEFTHAFNLHANGAAITRHAARKWLLGEAIPTQERISVLASWLGVHPAWLRFGQAIDPEIHSNAIPESQLATQHLALIRDLVSLPEPTQKAILGIVELFIRASCKPK
ncbi:MAG: hypothetical protein WKG03_10935 [Telluria sp.]